MTPHTYMQSSHSSQCGHHHSAASSAHQQLPTAAMGLCHSDSAAADHNNNGAGAIDTTGDTSPSTSQTPASQGAAQLPVLVDDPKRFQPSAPSTVAGPAPPPVLFVSRSASLRRNFTLCVSISAHSRYHPSVIAVCSHQLLPQSPRLCPARRPSPSCNLAVVLVLQPYRPSHRSRDHPYCRSNHSCRLHPTRPSAGLRADRDCGRDQQLHRLVQHGG